MAKAGFWLRGAKGKFAGATLYRGKSGTIQREIVGVTNPRTKAQVSQRIVFSTRAKFFSRAQKALFTFAFQNKKQNWSDFNAFMAYNKQSLFPTYQEVQDPNFPLVGSFVLTEGSLNPVYPQVGNESSTYGGHACVVAPCYFEDEEGDEFTWDQFLEENAGNYEVGDIITFVAIVSDAHYVSETGECVAGTHAPKWYIRQVQIKNGESLVKDDLALNGLKFCRTTPSGGFGLDISAAYGVEDMIVDESDKYVLGCAVIRSRRNGSKLEVSSSSIVLGCAGGQFYEYLLENEANAVASWGAKDDPILGGSLVQTEAPQQPKIVASGTIQPDETITHLAYRGFTLPEEWGVGDSVVIIMKKGSEVLNCTLVSPDSNEEPSFQNPGNALELGVISISKTAIPSLGNVLEVNVDNSSDVPVDVRIVSITIQGKKVYP